MDSIIPPASGPWLLVALALLIASLAGWVAQAAVKRIVLTHKLEKLAWHLILSIVLGSGLWCAHVVLASSQNPLFLLGYNLAAILWAWCMTILLTGMMSWVIGSGSMTRMRLVTCTLILAASIATPSILGIRAMGLQHGSTWIWPYVAFGATLAVSGAGLTLKIFFLEAKRQRIPLKAQALGSISLGLTAVLTQYSLIRAIDWNVEIFTPTNTPLESSFLSAMCAVGSLVLLITTRLGLSIESHLRALLLDAKSELQSKAFTDVLTGLPNRLAFERSLADAARRADQDGTRLAMLFINLDGFKPINELYGHHGGDCMLCEMASRLRSLTESSDHLARLGMDEFLLLMTTQASAESAASRAQQILNLLSQPCKFEAREASITCSIGIVMYPEHGAASRLIGHADTAMRATKVTGGAAFSFFEHRMLNDSREQVELLQALRGALDRKEFELFYQPKIDAPSGEITGVEALIRWKHPQRGVINPKIFIPLAERFGLINAVGAWVIEEACKQIRAWQQEGMRMRVAINLSAQQLQQADLCDQISGSILQHHINPALLTCEITESVAMEDAQTTGKLLDRLAAVGVHISIDDFGTGYSSLSYLRKLPAEELKIDSSFIMDLETGNDARAVVSAVIKLAQALGLKVVAEGVETEGQYQILRSLGCNQVQGYLFSKPLTAQALALWATRNEGPTRTHFRNSLFDQALPQSNPKH